MGNLLIGFSLTDVVVNSFRCRLHGAGEATVERVVLIISNCLMYSGSFVSLEQVLGRGPLFTQIRLLLLDGCNYS